MHHHPEPEESPPERSAPVSALDPDLIRAYRSARYQVQASPQPFVLTVDTHNSRLAALIHTLPARTAALVTACNPEGVLLTLQENRVAMAQLRSELRGRCAGLLDAQNSGAAGDWTEPSLLALGLSREAACALGRRWRQNAILHAVADAVPRLVLLR